LRLAAAAIGLTIDQCQPFYYQLDEWDKQGRLERPEAEQQQHKATCAACWNRPQCWPEEAVGNARLRMATMPCPIHSWECGGHGVGDELHRLIAEKIGEEPTHGCGCGPMITQCNRWGPEQARLHADEIADKMRKEGEQRGWWMKLAAALDRASETISATWGTKAMIEEACCRAEKSP